MMHSPPKSRSDTDLSNISTAAEKLARPSSGLTSVEDANNRKRKKPESEIQDAIDTFSAIIYKKLDDWRDELSDSIKKISENVTSIRADLSSLTQTATEMKKELNALRNNHAVLENRISGMDSKYILITQDISELKESIQFTDDAHNALKKQFETVSSQAINFDSINNIVNGLQSKIDSLEQQARSCNLEISNVPEKRNENLIKLMESICSNIKFPLGQANIIAIHRVPHALKDNNKPKNIIVKLSSRILRDNLLSAFRLAKGLNSDQLGFSDKASRIYMHEHLTLSRKLLFRECRDAAKKHGFTYVWIKHGTVLIRKTDNSPALAIRSPEDICKIKSGTGTVCEQEQ
ncbi:uncharacterized protein LOC126054638 [Helicoverpa armigera]|uniref:uncharacterized protein LOC126054638 n=1 Tax=Helicoverpa armigera TaxID=29058 RepID=UPI0030829853